MNQIIIAAFEDELEKIALLRVAKGASSITKLTPFQGSMTAVNTGLQGAINTRNKMTLGNITGKRNISDGSFRKVQKGAGSLRRKLMGSP